MLNDLYLVKYYGDTGAGYAVLYVGGNAIMGATTGGVLCKGKYTKEDGRIQMTATLLNSNFSAAGGGTDLITGAGARLVNGGTLRLTADLPADFDNGEPHKIQLDGVELLVRFEKIDTIP